MEFYRGGLPSTLPYALWHAEPRHLDPQRAGHRHRQFQGNHGRLGVPRLAAVQVRVSKVFHVWSVGVIGRGLFPLPDDGHGLLSIKVRYDQMQELVSFHIGNAEDGHWQVLTGRTTKAAGEETVLKLFEHFKDLRTLPSEESLAALKPFGFGKPVAD